MQNLNKENFWNNTEKAFPDAFKVFSEWIDKYKKEVDWDGLFYNGDFMVQDKPDWGTEPVQRAIKFHDLPFEFQIGILARFDVECRYGLVSGNGKTTWDEMRTHEPRRISHLFADLQNQITNRKNIMP